MTASMSDVALLLAVAVRLWPFLVAVVAGPLVVKAWRWRRG